jgi:hypothetical protein
MKNNKWKIEFELTDTPLEDYDEKPYSKTEIKEFIKDSDYCDDSLVIKKLKVTKV